MSMLKVLGCGLPEDEINELVRAFVHSCVHSFVVILSLAVARALTVPCDRRQQRRSHLS
jgi:hypothetical protein